MDPSAWLSATARFPRLIEYLRVSRLSPVRLGSQEQDLSYLTFHPGEIIPASGIYEVDHSNHRGPHRLTLRRGERFPTCQRCGYAVMFALVQSAPEVERSNWNVVLHRIPDVEEYNPSDQYLPEDTNVDEPRAA